MTIARAFPLFAALIATVVMLCLFPDRMIAPGKLSEAHVALGRDCFACHELFRGASSQKCRSCHVTDAGGAMTTIGVSRRGDARATPFHRAPKERNCLTCHSDHEGMKAYRAATSFSRKDKN